MFGYIRPLLMSLALIVALGAPAHAYLLEEPVNAEDVEAEVGELVNREREARGLPILRRSPALAQAARAHAEDMSQRGYFSHTTPDGKKAVTRCEEQGYDAYGGENIAGGNRTAEAVVTAWMNSTGHRNNILNPEQTEIGAGYHESTDVEQMTTWVVKFGREATR